MSLIDVELVAGVITEDNYEAFYNGNDLLYEMPFGVLSFQVSHAVFNPWLQMQILCHSH